MPPHTKPRSRTAADLASDATEIPQEAAPSLSGPPPEMERTEEGRQPLGSGRYAKLRHSTLCYISFAMLATGTYDGYTNYAMKRLRHMPPVLYSLYTYTGWPGYNLRSLHCRLCKETRFSSRNMVETSWQPTAALREQSS